jgi:hypothetical protein
MNYCFKYFLCVLLFFDNNYVFGQGYNHVWLHGEVNILDTFTTSTKARMLINANNDTILGEQRIMPFSSTQATISDNTSNFLFASNGCFIMDASGDTMQNGAGLNPGLFADSYCFPTSGLPMSGANLIIPYPGDSTKYVLIHQVGDFNNNLAASELFYTVIDMTLNNGLGGVVPNQKNVIAFTGTMSWGLAACKHGNGRDWWIVAFEDNANIIHKCLFTNLGLTVYPAQIINNMPPPTYGNAGQPCFSPDGTKLAYKQGRGGTQAFHDVRIFSFDRCTGNLDSIGYTIRNNDFGFGLSFSSSSQYLYYSSGGKIYQIDTNNPNIASTDTMVALNDGYCYPPGGCTNFWLMYLAANGKIYITSGGGVIDLHQILYPDLPDTSCGVRQHSIRMPCYTVRGGINHPNYYLGADTASTCDTLNVGLEERGHDFKFSLSPNPTSDGYIKLVYLLPQNKNGVFEIYNITGQLVFEMNLPPWSTLQFVRLPELSGGVYTCVVRSGNEQAATKLILMR